MYVKVFKVGKCVKVCWFFKGGDFVPNLGSKQRQKIREINFHIKCFFSRDEVSAIDAAARIFTHDRDTYYI